MLLCRGFYALMIIVPISLIIMFSFVIFILPVTQIKGRMNIMATLFLTLIGALPCMYNFLTSAVLLQDVGACTLLQPVGLGLLASNTAELRPADWQRCLHCMQFQKLVGHQLGRARASLEFRRQPDGH